MDELPREHTKHVEEIPKSYKAFQWDGTKGGGEWIAEQLNKLRALDRPNITAHISSKGELTIFDVPLGSWSSDPKMREGDWILASLDDGDGNLALTHVTNQWMFTENYREVSEAEVAA
ncbi:hypothetical protein AUR04nite_00200 [Glutamicibacter uratoxydans]|uniref:Uncharacterized protein n=1 Tax=Glutamicibacter uratoxydans TaxID=43667 RepID=A0A4Y4DMB2_GLUUR|nr:hypothetical protein [Glutamicibacter uratoxydans]GED04488.1 hypothetical protein AUR04nite_00200 [Glutamicibacter uratoxydans]